MWMDMPCGTVLPFLCEEKLYGGSTLVAQVIASAWLAQSHSVLVMGLICAPTLVAKYWCDSTCCLAASNSVLM
jgi:hypothetical protein